MKLNERIYSSYIYSIKFNSERQYYRELIFNNMKETSGFKNINDIQNTIEMQMKSLGKYIYYFNPFTNSTFKKKNRNKIIIKYHKKLNI